MKAEELMNEATNYDGFIVEYNSYSNSKTNLQVPINRSLMETLQNLQKNRSGLSNNDIVLVLIQDIITLHIHI